MNPFQKFLFQCALLFAFAAPVMNASGAGGPVEHETQAVIRTLSALIQSGRYAVRDPHRIEEGSSHWEASLRSTFERMLSERIPGDTVEERNWIQKITQALDWSAINRVFVGTAHAIRKVGRVNGIGIAYLFAAGISFDFVAPPLLHQFGLSALLPISTLAPYPVIFAGAGMSLQRLWYKREFIKMLGGKKAYRAYMAEKKKFQTELKKLNAKRSLFPFFTPEGQAVAFELSHGGLIEKMPWLKSVRYKDLKNYCIDHDLLSDLLPLMEDPRYDSLPEVSKSAWILTSLQNHEHWSVSEKVRFWNHFGKQAIPLPQGSASAEIQPEIFEWVEHLSKARSLTEISERLTKTPQSLGRDEAFQIWNEILIPHWGGSDVEMTLAEFKSLKKVSMILEAEARVHNYGSDHSRWLKSWGNEIEKIRKSGGDCGVALTTPLSWGSE